MSRKSRDDKAAKKPSQSSKTRESILDAVASLCAGDREPHELTLEEIASAACISRMTLYRHFANKRELLHIASEERGVALEAQEGTQEKIIRAARTAFAKDGFGSSMEQIAELADVGVATLYRQFGDKKSLISALGDYIRPNEMFDALELSASEDIEADLAAFGTALIARMQEHSDLVILVLRARLSGQELEGVSTGKTIARLCMYFERQKELGRITNTEEAADLAIGFMGMIFSFGWMYPALIGSKPEDPEHLGPKIARIFARGVN